jgi:hypothetical protein
VPKNAEDADALKKAVNEIKTEEFGWADFEKDEKHAICDAIKNVSVIAIPL